jgi:hypothetical protein
MPETSDLNALNEQVLADCVANRGRNIIGRSMRKLCEENNARFQAIDLR